MLFLKQLCVTEKKSQFSEELLLRFISSTRHFIDHLVDQYFFVENALVRLFCFYLNKHSMGNWWFKVTFSLRWDFQWKNIFDGNFFWWKFIFDKKIFLMKRYFWWKNIFDGKIFFDEKILMKRYFWWKDIFRWKDIFDEKYILIKRYFW